MTVWVTLLNVATGTSEVLLKLSPVPDMLNVHRQKDIGEVAELPLITMVVNCHLWYVDTCTRVQLYMNCDLPSWWPRTMYGYANDSIFPLFATQLFGELIGLVYNVVYFRWSSGPKRKQLRKLFSVAFAVWCLVSLFSVLALVGVFGQTKSEVGTMLGYVGVAFNLSMFSSPLGTLKHVVSTKNAASIPINMFIMILVSTALWVGSGLTDNDYFVAGSTAPASPQLRANRRVIHVQTEPTRRSDLDPAPRPPQGHPVCSSVAFQRRKLSLGVRRESSLQTDRIADDNRDSLTTCGLG